MRMNRDQIVSEIQKPHAGNLLLAHPHLLDPNFRRTVILLSAHTDREGSVGVIVNRAIGQTLGEYDPELARSKLASVPLFVGGPVATDQLILVAWKWSLEESTFKLYFGIDGEKRKVFVKRTLRFNCLASSGMPAGPRGNSMRSSIKALGCFLIVYRHSKTSPVRLIGTTSFARSDRSSAYWLMPLMIPR